MTFCFYTAVSILAVSFVHFLIGSLKHILLWGCFYPFLNVVFIYNTNRLMIHMTLTKNNMTNLGLNPVQLVRMVPYWVDCYVA